MLIDTIDFHHFIPLLLTLTLSGGHKVSAKAKPLGFIFSHTFQQMWCWSVSGSASWYCFWVRFNETMEITAVLLTAYKNLMLAWIWMFIDQYDSNLVWWYILLYTASFHHFYWIWHWFKVTQDCEKAKTSLAIISQSFQLIWMELDLLLRTVGVVNLILMLSHLFCVQGKEPYFWDFVKKKSFNIGLYSDIYGQISFKLGIMIETTKLYILISVLVTFTFIQGHRCMGNQKLWCQFFCKFEYQCWWNSVVATTCWFVGTNAKFNCAEELFKGENSADIMLWNIRFTLSCVRTLVNQYGATNY